MAYGIPWFRAFGEERVTSVLGVSARAAGTPVARAAWEECVTSMIVAVKGCTRTYRLLMADCLTRRSGHGRGASLYVKDFTLIRVPRLAGRMMATGCGSGLCPEEAQQQRQQQLNPDAAPFVPVAVREVEQPDAAMQAVPPVSDASVTRAAYNTLLFMVRCVQHHGQHRDGGANLAQIRVENMGAADSVMDEVEAGLLVTGNVVVVHPSAGDAAEFFPPSCSRDEPDDDTEMGHFCVIAPGPTVEQNVDPDAPEFVALRCNHAEANDGPAAEAELVEAVVQPAAVHILANGESDGRRQWDGMLEEIWPDSPEYDVASVLEEN